MSFFVAGRRDRIVAQRDVDVARIPEQAFVGPLAPGRQGAKCTPCWLMCWIRF